MWLAGLLEGEGCFTTADSGTSGRYKTPLISLAMTDHDVVEAAANQMTRLGRRVLCRSIRCLPSGKRAYQVQTTGLPAMRIMLTILPFMGRRRAIKIRYIFRSWRPQKYREAREFKRDHVDRLSSTPSTLKWSSR